MNSDQKWRDWIVRTLSRKKPSGEVKTSHEDWLNYQFEWEVLPVDFGPDWFVVRRKKRFRLTPNCDGSKV